MKLYKGKKGFRILCCGEVGPQINSIASGSKKLMSVIRLLIDPIQPDEG